MSKKILVAEDDKFLANAYRVKLTKAGYEVKLASDGVEVFKVLEDFQPELIILDLVMPIKDGFSTLEELKQHQSYKEIPVLIASNLGQQEDIDRGINLGAKDYIIKSDLSLDELIQKVETII
jgi:DNA-binding response OmpR family regulator